MNYNLKKMGFPFCTKPVQICIGADFVPTDSNRVYFMNEDAKGLLGDELYSLLRESDLNIFNLEAPITDSELRLDKAGSPNLKTYTEITKVLTKLHPVLLSCANNHILDYGWKGIEDTFKTLDEAEIDHVGAGSDIEEAKRPYIMEINGIKIGVYSCSENEFSSAKKNRGGGNGYDPLNTFDDIRNTKNECDYLIVLHHGGRENYRYPSPMLKTVCNKMADSGADIVICQHSHCIGAFEKWNESLIIYGQGNTLFDFNDLDEWKTGLIIRIIISGGLVSVDAIPIEKCDSKVRLSKNDEIINGLKARSEEILSEEMLEEKWHLFCLSQRNTLLLRGVMGVESRFLLGVNKLLSGVPLKLLFGRKHRLLLSNYIRCESIREAVLDVLNEELS